MKRLVFQDELKKYWNYVARMPDDAPITEKMNYLLYEEERRRSVSGAWSPWNPIGWNPGYDITQTAIRVKASYGNTQGGKIYLITPEYIDSNGVVVQHRWEISPIANKILEVY